MQSSGLCYSPPRSKRTHCQLITGRLLIFPSSTSAHALYGTSAAAWEVCCNPRCADCSATHCKLIVRGRMDLTEGRCARGPCQLYCLEGLRPLSPATSHQADDPTSAATVASHTISATRGAARTSAPPLRSHALYLLEPGRRPSRRVPPSKRPYLVPKGTAPRAHDGD